MHIPDQESRGHILPRGTYLATGAALLFLTVITVAASYVDWGAMTGLGFAANIIVAMFIATIKALLVIMFFMHMKYESKLTWGFGLLYPLVIFAILVTFLAIDVFLRVVPEKPGVILEQEETSLQIETPAPLRGVATDELAVANENR